MKKYFILILIASAGLFSCKQGTTDNSRQDESSKTKEVSDSTAYIHPGLSEAWQTPDSLDVPESVFHISGQQYVVSNVNGAPMDVDHNGYLSLLSGEGTIAEQHWVDGLNAPKGLAISDGKLYVSDIQDLVVVDMENGTIEKRYHAPDAQFLNDVAADKQGNVYVSDMNGKAIYRLHDQHFSIWLKDDRLDSVNGLLVYQGALYAGTADQLLKVDMNNGTIQLFIDHTGSIDGLDHFRDQQFFISDWTGHVYLVEQGKVPVLLLDTTPLKINAADISYDRENNLLLVPTFSGNSIDAYKVTL